MATRSLRPPLTLSIILLFLAILGSLHLMSSATQDASALGELYSTLVLTNALAGLLLLTLVGVNIYWVIRELRRKAAGSNLTSRMIFLFSLLTMAPAAIVFYYSMQFLDRSIDSWFDVNIDHAMEDALELGQTALDERMRNVSKELEQTAEKLATSPVSLMGVRLNELNEMEDAELTLFTRQGHVISYSGAHTESFIPALPDINVMIQVRRGKPYVGLEGVGAGGLQIRAVAPIMGEDSLYLQAIYPIPRHLAQLTDTVESAYLHYKEMTFLRGSLKFTFSLTLSLILLLSLLAAVWSAFLSIRRIVEPVRLLAIGTRSIAAGDYEKRLPVNDRGELGFLVESFNSMTAKIAQSRDQAERSQRELQAQHAYLETLLASLSSAVLSLDARGTVLTANQAANTILHADFSQYLGWPLAVLTGAYPHIAELMNALSPHIDGDKQTWTLEVGLQGPGGRQELFCRGTTIEGVGNEGRGHVLVIDDVTALIQAQRNSAWSEVARRLAHEIKNPLTPIQLSAERLRHKLSKVLVDGDLEMLEKSTRTIVQQVEAMKSMVNAFAEYAKPTIVQLCPIAIRPLLDEIVALYPPSSGIAFEFSHQGDVPEILADPVKLRQVVHNLIKNAQEAMPQGHEGKVTLSTRRTEEAGTEQVEVRISDNGPGIPPEQSGRIFEPYVTTKSKGTGLGLAIVKRIVEEFGGKIRLDSHYHNGASFVIILPVAPDSQPKAP
jgi:nitrogen fixation/metabolism regulation signal transduction histidine kinase